MPQSFGVYGGQNQGVQPWSQTITLFPGSQNVSNFFSLYNSLGDATLTGANTVATLLDGPEQVVRYGNLTVGDGTTATSLTAASRCKGLTILCDTLTVKANATVNMTGKGARVMTGDDLFFPIGLDFKIPSQITLSSSQVTPALTLAAIKAQGFAPWDLGTWQALVAALYGFNLGIAQTGSVTLLNVTGCGDGGAGVYCSSAIAGAYGIAGANGGMGGGGCGGVNATSGIYQTPAGKGCPYAGGSGVGGTTNSSTNASPFPLQSRYSGRGGRGGAGMWNAINWYVDDLNVMPINGGGGAGNPGGLGGGTAGQAGGKLVIIARTSIVVASGGKIEANGMPGGDAGTYGGGGGSGGGHVCVLTPSLSNAGTLQASGGLGGDQAYQLVRGGNGGAGSVVTQTFIDMGW